MAHCLVWSFTICNEKCTIWLVCKVIVWIFKCMTWVVVANSHPRCARTSHAGKSYQPACRSGICWLAPCGGISSGGWCSEVGTAPFWPCHRQTDKHASALMAQIWVPPASDRQQGRSTAYGAASSEPPIQIKGQQCNRAHARRSLCSHYRAFNACVPLLNVYWCVLMCADVYWLMCINVYECVLMFTDVSRCADLFWCTCVLMRTDVKWCVVLCTYMYLCVLM